MSPCHIDSFSSQIELNRKLLKFRKMRSSSLVLFICAGLLLTGGAVLCFWTLWNLLRMSYYFWTTELGAELATCTLFITGALLCLPACWLATLVPYYTKSPSLITTLMALTTVSLMLLATGLSGTSALSRTLRERGALNDSMQRAMAYDAHDPSVRSSFAAMQLELRCCGVVSNKDWYRHRRTLPPSCCGKVWYGKRTEICESALYASGCLQLALMELRQFVSCISTLGSALIVIMGVTLFTCAYILVVSVVERREAHKPQQPLRIACLSTHAPPLVSVTSPTFIPTPPPPM